MLEIENSLLTGAIQVDSDLDGNVIILQNKQEIKLTPSQAKEIKEHLHNLDFGLSVEKERQRKLIVKEAF